MTHVFVDPDQLDWNTFVQKAGQQIGNGPTPFPIFVGNRYQRGSGILSSIGRFLLPIAKNIAQTAGQEGIAAGTRVLSDLSQGRSVGEALREHSKRGVENLATKLAQCGKGRKGGGKRRRGRPRKAAAVAALPPPTTVKNGRRQRYDQLTFA